MASHPSFLARFGASKTFVSNVLEVVDTGIVSGNAHMDQMDTGDMNGHAYMDQMHCVCLVYVCVPLIVCLCAKKSTNGHREKCTTHTAQT